MSNARESRHYLLTAGHVFHLSPLVKLSPAFLIRYQEDNRLGYDISLNTIFDNIAYVGLSYRNSGDISFMTQIILNLNLRIGYAYDLNLSEINNVSAGTHEVLVNYRIKLRNARKDPQCPVYF